MFVLAPASVLSRATIMAVRLVLLSGAQGKEWVLQSNGAHSILQTRYHCDFAHRVLVLDIIRMVSTYDILMSSIRTF